MNNKTTEQPPPADVLRMFRDLADKNNFYKSRGQRHGFDTGYIMGSSHEYLRHLHSLPPSPVGEAIAFAKWIGGQKDDNKLTLVDNDWYWDSDTDGDQPLTEERLCELFLASRPNPSRAEETELDFQSKVAEWVVACFGEAIAMNKVERNFRFLEEALELVQANGCSKTHALALVDYVYSRAVGEIKQECGGVMVTLACLAKACEISINECGNTELTRVWGKMEQIRMKQAAKKIVAGPLP